MARFLLKKYSIIGKDAYFAKINLKKLHNSFFTYIFATDLGI